MAKNKNGKELGKGISQRKDGRYSARFGTQGGKRVEKYFHTLHEARNWLLQAKAQEGVHADVVSLPEDAPVGAELSLSSATTVDDWFDFCQNTLWADLAPSTRRSRQERYDFNMKPLIGHLSLENVKPLHCIPILNGMEKPYNRQGKVYASSTIRPFCMHTLRHTFATRCIEYGIRPKVLQQILGHASLKTTMDRYVHNTEDSMTDAVNLFEEGCRENGVNFLKMA